MDSWQFMDYISPQGRNMIADWYARLLKQAQSDFMTLIRILAKTRQWKDPAFKHLKSKYQGMGEIRFTSERKEHRVIGFRWPGPQQFTMLIGCFHKQRVYTPANALDTALQRKRFLEQGEGSVHDRKI
jgi:phage-related protein